MVKCYVVFILILSVTFINCEWFSSLGQLGELLTLERDMMASLQKYVETEQNKLNQLIRFLQEYEKSAEVKQKPESYLSHPINQYHLIKSIFTKTTEIAQIVNQNQSMDVLSHIYSLRIQSPRDEDLKASAEAIMRLQDTYKLNVSQILEGNIAGFHSAFGLSADDIYHIAHTAYLNGDNYHCALWMKEVENKICSSSTVSQFDVLDHLSFCVAKLGFIDYAMKLTGELLEMEPDNSRLIGNMKIYRGLVDDLEQPLQLIRTTDRPFLLEYEELCRREPVPPSWVERRLRCYYWTNHNTPRLLLQPIKIEELWHSPQLIRFYDIVSDDEIEDIKTIAKPKLNRATVHNPETGRLEHAHYRVSKSAWFEDEDYQTIARVSQRISDVTGFSMETAEGLQVANYGVAGQYEPHFDFIAKEENVRPEEGNRIATFLIYLSDVDHGGSTVFLHPRLAVKPVKRSAVFWYNLLPTGAGDTRTRHAACPVSVGIKWVANKWIHERGQEFLVPCTASRPNENRLF